MKKLLKLGIAMDYPVNWDFEKILRDLIQNFYDPLGPESFGKEFHYDYDYSFLYNECTVSMWSSHTAFDYEWLVYIGGSTKTEREDMIGQYGEGFKLCMLSLMRMGISSVEMHSKDWLITPCDYTEMIDGSSVKMLGYHLSEARNDGRTSLKLKGVPGQYQRELDEALFHFFYKGNPLFGNKITSSESHTIYRSSGKAVPSYQWPEPKGILYVNHLARGRLDIPLFVDVCGKNLRMSYETRERKVLEPHMTFELMYAVALAATPEESLALLKVLRNKWSDMPAHRYDVNTWYYFICQLVRNVASSEKSAERFHNEYPYLAYLERDGLDRKHNQVIHKARIWAEDHNTKKLVNPVFRLLGAENLVRRYQNETDLNLRKADETEQHLTEIVMKGLKAVVPESVNLSLPELWIGAVEKSEQNPLSYADSVIGQKSAAGTYRRRYKINRIVLSEEDFRKDRFEKTFVKLADKLLHIYGSSRSDRMNVIFTYFGAWVLQNKEAVDLCRQEWEKTFN